MRTAKILIRLGGCPGWSESSLGAHSFCWFCHFAAHFLLSFSCLPRHFAKTLATSDARLVRYAFRCPDARHVFLKMADVTVASELTVWSKRFSCLLFSIVCWYEIYVGPAFLKKMIDVKCFVFKVSVYTIYTIIEFDEGENIQLLTSMRWT